MPEEIAARIGRPDAPDPPGVSAARIAWLVQGYLRIESALTRLGHVVAPSQAMADFMLAHGFPSKLVHVIPYGIELRPSVADSVCSVDRGAVPDWPREAAHSKAGTGHVAATNESGDLVLLRY